MLGQPVSMLIPKVVGFKLTGEIPPGATATDVVLTITEMLRRHGVVGKFVEFYGEGVGAVPLANRATIGNMSPEFGSTAAIFPIDDETIRYMKLTGRSGRAARAHRGLRQGAGPLARPGARARLLRDPRARPRHGRPVDRGPEAPAGPHRAHRRQVGVPPVRCATTPTTPRVRPTGVDESNEESFPASDSPAPGSGTTTSPPRRVLRGRGRRGPTVQADHGQSRVDRGEFVLDHGAVVIASITSCTNTSNPSVMLGAALLAKNAVEKGLTVKPWVKTSMAPGSKVVTDYYEKAGLWPYLEKLGYHLVGYGCTTCIGNSGPLSDEISAAVNAADLTVCLGALGQPQLRGPDQPGHQDELPRLAAAGHRLRPRGHDGLRLREPAAGHRHRRHRGVPARRLAVGQGRAGHDRHVDQPGDVHQGLRRRLRGRRALEGPAHAGGQRPSRGTSSPPTCASPRTSTGWPRSPRPSSDITGARVLALLGDSVTTDHISPAGSIKAGHPRCGRTSTSTASTRATTTPSAPAAATTR